MQVGLIKCMERPSLVVRILMLLSFFLELKGPCVAQRKWNPEKSPIPVVYGCCG